MHAGEQVYPLFNNGTRISDLPHTTPLIIKHPGGMRVSPSVLLSCVKEASLEDGDSSSNDRLGLRMATFWNSVKANLWDCIPAKAPELKNPNPYHCIATGIIVR